VLRHEVLRPTSTTSTASRRTSARRPRRDRAGTRAGRCCDDDEGDRAVVYFAEPMIAGSDSLLRPILTSAAMPPWRDGLGEFSRQLMALATPSLRATVFTRARSTPLSFLRARDTDPAAAGGAGFRRHCELPLGPSFTGAARGPGGDPLPWRPRALLERRSSRSSAAMRAGRSSAKRRTSASEVLPSWISRLTRRRGQRRESAKFSLRGIRTPLRRSIIRARAHGQRLPWRAAGLPVPRDMLAHEPEPPGPPNHLPSRHDDGAATAELHEVDLLIADRAA